MHIAAFFPNRISLGSRRRFIMCLLMHALIYHTLKNKRNTKNKLQQRPAAESMALNCWNQCNLVVREFNSNAALPMPQNYHFNFYKDTPCRCTQADTQPPLHLRAFASQYLPCPFQTQQHDNQPFISLSSLSPSILPPSAILFAIQTWKLCWMTPRFRHTLVSHATSSLLTFQKRRKTIFVWIGP